MTIETFYLCCKCAFFIASTALVLSFLWWFYKAEIREPKQQSRNNDSADWWKDCQ